MSTASPLVSILVPAYNAATYLPQLCRSLQAQTFRDFEVLIFDDGSTDNTAEVFSPFAQDPRFQLAGWKQNRGGRRMAARFSGTAARVAGGEHEGGHRPRRGNNH
jgi:glycosyltransferase involved in cell wall biosynthesis